MTDDIYDPGSSDKLWKNPFSSSNPLDAMLNFGNPGNSNDWKNDQSSSDFVIGRDRLEPYNDEPEIIKTYKKRTTISPLKETVVIEEESIEDINSRQCLLKQRLENLISSRYSEHFIPRKSKSTFGAITKNGSLIYVVIILILFFIILFLLFK
jgi:hypothetical protein